MTIKQLLHNLIFGEQNRRNNWQKHYEGISVEERQRRTSLAIYTSPDLGRVFGCDIAGKWDGLPDFSVFKSRGGAFVFVKGLDGSVQASLFVENRNNAIHAGLLQAPYQWLYRNANVSCVAQARAAHELLQKYPGDLPLMLDFEWTYWLGSLSNPNYVDLDLWATEFLHLGNQKPILYSAPGYMNELGKIPDSLKAKFSALCIANYGVTSPGLPLGYTSWDFWQFTDCGDATYWAPNDVGTKELDMDYWHSDLASLQQFAGTTPTQEPVPHTQPAPGIDEYMETVNGKSCHVSVVDMTGKQFKVRHFSGHLGYVSGVAKEPNVLMAFPGEDWNKYASEKYYPKHRAYTDGRPCQHTEPDSDLPYVLNVSSTNQIWTGFKDFPALWNAISFIRPLVIDGNVAPDIRDHPTKIEYTEIHAVTGLGYRADGTLVHILGEGKVDPDTGIAYEGITVPQLVDLFLKYNVIWAGQLAGGGDAAKAILGVIVNQFSDPTERAVVQVIEIVSSTGDNIMNGIAKERLGNIPVVRMTPSRYGREIVRHSAGWQTEFVDYVDAQIQGPADKPGEKWLKLPDGNYVNYRLYTNGVLTDYFAILMEPSPDTPPEPPAAEGAPREVIVKMPDGSIWSSTQFTKQ